MIVVYLLEFQRGAGDITAEEIRSSVGDILAATVATNNFGTYTVDPTSLMLDGE